MVEKDKIYDLKIDGLGSSGEGVGKINSFTIFVSRAIPGDIVKVKINILKKNYGVGELLEIIEPSEDRIEPKCPNANICGGCQIMHMSYGAQLEMKRKIVEDSLTRIGKIDTTVNPTLGMDNPYEYRNKAQFPVGVIDGKAILGFYKMGTHDIVDTEYCHIQSPINEKIVKIVKRYIEDFSVKVYDEKSRTGLIRHIVTKAGFTTGEVMIVIVTNGRDLPQKNQLIEMFKENIEGLKSVVQNINTKNTNVIFGQETITLYGEDKIVDYIGNLKFHISAQSFFQVNPTQTKVLYEKALEYADLSGNERVFDIYCGIGTISLFLAQKAKEVHGVEVVEAAIKDARENASINNINNANFYVGKAEEVVPRLYKQGIRADVVVVDPPRKGCEESVLETIVNMEPKRIVYVSCNPATLARDLAYLDERGYNVDKVQPVDMFPHTSHCESICLLHKK